MSYLTYFLYIILWEGFSLGGAGYVVFYLHRSPLWILLGLFLSASGYHPERWIHGVVPEAEEEAE